MSQKKKTFKQRARKNEMKARHKVSSELRKRMRAASRRHNRFDHTDSDSRPLEELVEDIARGSAAPTREVALDPRSLTDLLLQHAGSNNNNNNNRNSNSNGVKNKDNNSDNNNNNNNTRQRMMLPDGPLPDDHPLSIPELPEEESAAKANRESVHAENKNKYRHHGDPYLFWERVALHPLLRKSLKSMHFTHPTPVQEEVLSSVLSKSSMNIDHASRVNPVKKGKKKESACGKDVIISAETGSGKTLAFALPILHHILTTSQVTLLLSNTDAENIKPTNPKNEITTLGNETTEITEAKLAVIETNISSKKKRKRLRESDETSSCKVINSNEKSCTEAKHRLMQALIISPTRELALQINEAFLQLTQHAPQVVVGCIVGGMAPEKQQRVLNRHPHVLICTPGRLWDLVQKNEGCYLGHSISRRLSFIVLDEADKLLQSGRFEELKSLLERIHCEVLPAGFVQEREAGAVVGETELQAGRWDEETQTFVPFSSQTTGERNEVEGMELRRQRKDDPRFIPMPPNPPEGHRVVTFVTSATLSLQTNYERKDLRSKRTLIRTTNADTMMIVLQKLEIKSSNAQVFTISPKADVAAKIRETYLRCPGESKDLYLYYFLKMYRERIIIFVNAISMLRRLIKLLEVLGIPAAGLHASLQQRQRLKYIDKFKKGERSVLVATDIASRGLDVEGVKYIIHFQIPRSTDAYIHRCGRTARCGGTGLSVLLVNAKEHVSFKKLLDSLDRQSSEMEVFALQPTIVHQLHSHIRIALQIDKLQKEIDKSRAQNNWARRMSREADIEVDDMINDEADDENRARERAIKVLKKELSLLVQKDMGKAGGKGGFRTSAQALGAKKAEEKLVRRATMQVTQKDSSIKNN